MRDPLITAAVTTLRAAARWAPQRLRARIENRIFGAVHHLTRVTNDAYPQPKMPDEPTEPP